ncbi:uncharacterized protein MYCFIDRAFT_27933, partial [Pseudocercospora fijiensis CIRAD86]
QHPSLIVPLNQSFPHIPSGPSKNATAGPHISSILNFDIPASAVNKTCAFWFFFPNETQIDPSSFVYSGEEEHLFRFFMLEEPAMANTSLGNAPYVKYRLAEKVLIPGDDQMVEAIDCPAGETMGILWEGVSDSYLSYTENYAPCPIGLFIDIG